MSAQGSFSIADLVRIADGLRQERMADFVKCCSPALEQLRELFGSHTNASQSAMVGLPVYINEEIPPDRIVFYDQRGEVLRVVQLPPRVGEGNTP